MPSDQLLEFVALAGQYLEPRQGCQAGRKGAGECVVGEVEGLKAGERVTQVRRQRGQPAVTQREDLRGEKMRIGSSEPWNPK